MEITINDILTNTGDETREIAKIEQVFNAANPRATPLGALLLLTHGHETAARHIRMGMLYAGDGGTRCPNTLLTAVWVRRHIEIKITVQWFAHVRRFKIYATAKNLTAGLSFPTGACRFVQCHIGDAGTLFDHPIMGITTDELLEEIDGVLAETLRGIGEKTTVLQKI